MMLMQVKKNLQVLANFSKTLVSEDQEESILTKYTKVISILSFLFFLIIQFFTYSIARRRRRLSGRHMYMFSRHRKLDF